MSSRPSGGGGGSSKRPASIQELADRAFEFTKLWDPSTDFKFWLKTAERARHSAQEYETYGDIENAFVEYAKAATLILDKIPTHRDYHTRLDSTQRDTLVLVCEHSPVSSDRASLERVSMNRKAKVFWIAWAS